MVGIAFGIMIMGLVGFVFFRTRRMDLEEESQKRQDKKIDKAEEKKLHKIDCRLAYLEGFIKEKLGFIPKE